MTYGFHSWNAMCSSHFPALICPSQLAGLDLTHSLPHLAFVSAFFHTHTLRPWLASILLPVERSPPERSLSWSSTQLLTSVVVSLLYMESQPLITVWHILGFVNYRFPLTWEDKHLEGRDLFYLCTALFPVPGTHVWQVVRFQENFSNK